MHKSRRPDFEEPATFDEDGETRWDETFRRSEDLLEKLADRALAQFKAGETQRKGFDEL